MGSITVTRTIQAPVEKVFDAVAHIERFSEAVPQITRVEFLTETRRGVGTRFRETRVMGGREASTELEVTEYAGNERIRIVADSHGSVWDTVFTVEPAGDEGTRLTMVMEDRPHKFVAKMMNAVMRGMIRKAVSSDLDAVKEFCEKPGAT